MVENENQNPKNKKTQESGSGNAPAEILPSDSIPGSFYSSDIKMDDNGWVKNFRKIKEWEWYRKPNMAHLFQHLIREANHKDKHWQGILVKRGQIITGSNTLAEETGLSRQNIRTCLEHLKKTVEITIKPTNKYSIITICNYEKYQNPYELTNHQANHQLTSNQPATNHKQERKNEKKKNNKGTVVPIPDWLDKDLWKDFKDHRKKLKKPMTKKAEEILIAKLSNFRDKGYNPKHLLITSIERGWQSVFEPKEGS